MANVLNCGARGLGWSPSQGYCVVFLGINAMGGSKLRGDSTSLRLKFEVVLKGNC